MAGVAIAANQKIKLKVYCMEFNQLGENILDYNVGVVQGAVDATTLADLISAAIAPLYIAWLNDKAVYKGVEVLVTSGNVQYLTAKSTSGTGSGPAGNPPQPRQVSGLIKKITQFAGRGNYGRMYVPFPYVDKNDTTGNVSAAQVAALDGIGAQLLKPSSYGVAPNTVRLDPLLLHEYDADLQVQPPPTPITDFSSSYLWATQRRRSDFGKINSSPV